MQYAAMTFWLLVIVFAALGVHRLWSGLIAPRTVNLALLPGTLVAQVGRVVGLLVTGSTVNNTALLADDDSAEPQTGKEPKSRVPLLGPVVVALLPLAACATAIGIVSEQLGRDVLARLADATLPRTLPTSLDGVWLLMRQCVTLVERLVEAVRVGPLGDWRTWAFVYLVICLTVRMAPLPGTMRGAVLAIFAVGVVAAAVGAIASSAAGPRGFIEHAWSLISFSVAALLFLLLLSLTVRAIVGLVRILSGREKAT